VTHSETHSEHSELSAALGELENVLGEAFVLRDAQALRDAATATFQTTSHVQAVLRPGTREDVQACVRIANRHHVSLYPFSTGKNWGYGSRAPVHDAILLDLGRLNRIVDFDETLAYVTIEPGVTQRQLHEFLTSRGSRLWMDATGASPDCSIIGNTLERGFGHTPMGDHCGNVCGFEVVLPTGECIQTGFGRYDGAKATSINRWGVGPSLDGLFSQSNFGIVTRLSVLLMPAPEHFQAFFFVCKGEDGLAPVIDALRPLRLNGTLRSVMHIGNDYKVLTAAVQFPWDDPSIKAPIDAEAMRGLRKKLNVGTWNGSGALYGTKAQVREARAQLRRALAGKVERLQFVDDRLIRIMSRFATPFRLATGWDISKTLAVIEPVYNLLKGVPTEGPLASAYWRKRTPPPADMDPDRDGCGLLWCSPVVPNTGRDISEVTRLATDVLLEHGFEPQMSISLATERTLICITTISYDRAVAGEDARAMTCYRTLVEQLIARGYPPYRLNVETMEYAAPDSAYSELIGKLKQAVDPDGILAPGRYDGSVKASAVGSSQSVPVRVTSEPLV
jgi:4-cresol dehydrogenase (hydroxylating)